MRAETDKAKLAAFVEAVGTFAKGPGSVYLVGGSCAVLLGIRDQTIDIDLKLDPEPRGVFEAIAKLKDQLAVNVELASPDQFIPPLPGWRERSEFIERAGQVEFFHYDFYGQALAKILRGHEVDVSDARAFVKLGKVHLPLLKQLFDEIKPALLRYPAVNPDEFERRVAAFIAEVET